MRRVGGRKKGGEGLEQTELKVTGLKEKKACNDKRCFRRHISYFTVAVVKTS